MGKISDIRWIRALIAAIGAFVLGFLAVLILVAGFVVFNSASQPDLTSFSKSLLPALVALVAPLVFTLLAAWWHARGVSSGKQINGLFVGVLVVLISLIYRGFHPTVTEFAIVVSTLLISWFGGHLAQRGAK